MSDPIRAAWAADDGGATAPTPAALRRRARTLNRATRRRDAVEYVAALIVVAFFTHRALQAANAVVLAGCVLIVLGTGAVIAGLWRRRTRPAPDALAEASQAYLRDQLIRQRDLLADVARWYLAPPLPGLLTFAAGTWLDLRQRLPEGLAAGAALLAVAAVAGTFGAIWWLNRRAARALEHEIAALDAADVIDRG